MCSTQLLLIATAPLAEGLHCEPCSVGWREEARCDLLECLPVIVDSHDSLCKVRHSGVARHAGRLLLLRVTVSLLSLCQQGREAIPPGLLVLYRGKRLENPAELLFALSQEYGRSWRLPTRILGSLRLKLQMALSSMLSGLQP